jgi:hypothetical protein
MILAWAVLTDPVNVNVAPDAAEIYPFGEMVVLPNAKEVELAVKAPLTLSVFLTTKLESGTVHSPLLPF